jgi:uncharacterized protein YdaU (DUF1376 family)
LDGAMKGDCQVRRNRDGWHQRRTTRDETNPNNGAGRSEGAGQGRMPRRRAHWGRRKANAGFTSRSRESVTTTDGEISPWGGGRRPRSTRRRVRPTR